MESLIATRKDRWRRFFNGNAPHRFLYQIRYQPDQQPRPKPWPNNVPQQLEWIWDNYRRMCQRITWLDDDALPYLDMMTGTELFAEAFGCPVYRPDNDMPSARPMVFSAREAARIKVPGLDAPPLKRVFDMADELQKRAGKDVLFRNVDIQSPVDIAALIWDKTDLLMAMIESPEVVKELIHKTKQLLIAFLDEWYRRYGRQHIAHFPDYFMDGGWSVSEDEVGVVNPEMFEEFFLPELNELSDRYGGIGMHCCANSCHQWGNFKKIRQLKLLNICQPPRVLQEAYHCFERDVVHYHNDNWTENWDPAAWRGRYPRHARLVVDVTATSKEQALCMAERLSSRH